MNYLPPLSLYCVIARIAEEMAEGELVAAVKTAPSLGSKNIKYSTQQGWLWLPDVVNAYSAAVTRTV